MDAAAIESLILLVRGRKVMLDSDLARIYGVSTKRLNEQVGRNAGRFPADFMFRLSTEEAEIMRSQIATASRRNVRYRPCVFTEHGAVMLASVLSTPAAVQASVEVVRAFIRLRAALAAHKDIARRLDELERRYEARFKSVFDALRELTTPSKEPPRRPWPLRCIKPMQGGAS